MQKIGEKLANDFGKGKFGIKVIKITFTGQTAIYNYWYETESIRNSKWLNKSDFAPFKEMSKIKR